MNWYRIASLSLIAAAVVAGTAADRPVTRPVLIVNGYRVLAADFHTHSSMWSDGALTPWGLVLEAERQGLDAIAITGHDEVWDSRVGRWFSRLVQGPTVLTGEEILSPKGHFIAIGVERLVRAQRSTASEIDEIHAQGGVAIAAHPMQNSWTDFDAGTLQRLDGSEVCHPLVFGNPSRQRELEQFASRASFAAIGSSDFHRIGRLGSCRTYVFARAASPGAILEAIRARRTVVFGGDGKAYGDAELAAALAARRPLPDAATAGEAFQRRPDPYAEAGDTPIGWLDVVSRVCGVLGLAGIVLPAGRCGARRGRW